MQTISRTWRLGLPAAMLLVAAAGAAGEIPEGVLIDGSPASGLTLQDARGFRWDIDRVGAVQDGTSDAYDGGMQLRVNDALRVQTGEGQHSVAAADLAELSMPETGVNPVTLRNHAGVAVEGELLTPDLRLRLVDDLELTIYAGGIRKLEMPRPDSTAAAEQETTGDTPPGR